MMRHRFGLHIDELRLDWVGLRALQAPALRAWHVSPHVEAFTIDLIYRPVEQMRKASRCLVIISGTIRCNSKKRFGFSPCVIFISNSYSHSAPFADEYRCPVVVWGLM